MKEKRRPLTAKEKKQLDKKRRKAAKQAQKYHKLQKKENNRKSSSKDGRKGGQAAIRNENQRASYEALRKKRKNSGSVINHDFSSRQGQAKNETNSKIINAVNSHHSDANAYLSREEKFRKDSEKIIQNLEPQDFDDGGYYVDEYTARQKQERRAREIRNQEAETIRRPKKHLTPQQVKRRRILTYSGIFVVVLIIGVILSLTVLFKTEKIEVTGDNYYYEDQIIGFSNVELQQNIFIAVLGSTPKAVIDNLPYVEDVKISFNVPDTITIKVTDAVPSYVIANGNGYLLVSSKGRILENIDDNPDKLPKLTCDELKSTKVGDYVSFSNKNIPDILDDISESLNANNVKNITGFDVTDTANITLNYDNRILINLGLPEDIDYKIRTAITIINEKLDPNNTRSVMGTLDVSACNTTKVSRYKPIETQPTTVAPTTVLPSTSAEDNYDDENYQWDSNEDGISAEPSEDGNGEDGSAQDSWDNQDDSDAQNDEVNEGDWDAQNNESDTDNGGLEDTWNEDGGGE